MLEQTKHLRLLVARLGITFFIYFLCRLFFYLLNTDLFPEANWLIFIHGLRFDASAVFYSNILFILLHIIPIAFRESKAYQSLLKILFHTSNTLAIVFNCVDIIYFRFTAKRSTYDLFSFISNNDDTAKLLPQFIKDYWYIPLLIITLLLTSNFLYNKTLIYFFSKKNPLKKQWLLQSFIGIMVLSISIVAMRGGFQLKPLRISTAGKYTSGNNISLLLNTPFTLLKTIGSEFLEDLNFYDQVELSQLYNPIKVNSHTESNYKNWNVVILIMESFSKEYIGGLTQAETSTPFLDSLIQNGLICTDAYSNGKKSIEALPAIISSTPTLMNTPFSTSPYGANSISGLPLLLKQQGYSSSFFHGGNNGTMAFDIYCKTAGFDKYHGRNEYNKEDDYDGNWGIFDEPFLQYFSSELDKNSNPFFSCFFSLTSHHPYSLPKEHVEKFGKNGNNLKSSIAYADYSLKKFFETAKKSNWFNRTIFVITADHTGVSEDLFYGSDVGKYQIPILFYTSDNALKGKFTETVQQIDIFPSVLDLVGYNKSFFSFGESIFNPHSNRFAINFINDRYQLISNGLAIQFSTEKFHASTHYPNYAVNKPLANSSANTNELYRLGKAIIQTYNKSLINNQLTAP